MDGFLIVDKQKGETSFDVVRRIRKEYGEKKVGHSGTLDPLATGLMIVALGKGTKLLEYLIGCDKEYQVRARFGEKSDTYDAEGKIEVVDTDAYFDQDAVRQAIEENFVGKVMQRPPVYSALKVGGRRAADIVRAGGEVELADREVTVYEFEMLDYDWPEVDFRVSCSSGTYIRSLVNDLGEALGCGAYVKELRRTKIKDFEKASDKLITIDQMAEHFLCFELDDDDFEGLKDGKILANKKVEHRQPILAVYKENVVGVLENVEQDGEPVGIKYKKVI